MSEEWIEVLRDQCMDRSQAKVAKQLQQSDGFPSQTVINQVLGGSYAAKKGRDRLQALVEGKYLGLTTECPQLGEIGLDVCEKWQAQPYMAVNPLRTQMYRACRACPNRREEDQ